MLARHFKTPAALGIAGAEFDAFVQLLEMLERCELVHVESLRSAVPNGFNMSNIEVSSEFGLTACIFGWVKRLSGMWVTEYSANSKLAELFCPWSIVGEKPLRKIAQSVFHDTVAAQTSHSVQEG